MSKIIFVGGVDLVPKINTENINGFKKITVC